MSRLRVALVVFALIVTLPVVLWGAGADKSPEDVLASKGLIRSGSYYLLESDIQLPQSLKATRAAEAKLQDSTRRRGRLERDVAATTALIENLEAQNREQTAALEGINKSIVYAYNKQVDRVNAIRGKLREALVLLDRRQQALQALGDPADEYVNAVLKLSDVTEAAAKQYEALVTDPGVQQALRQLNAAGPVKFRLGPSERFAQELPATRKLRQTVNSDVIRFDSLAGVALVPVTINGKVQAHMIVDSGASNISISSELAEQLGLHPDPSDKVDHFTLADGRVVDAHLKILKSVRLGKFTVENVECAIQPPTVKGADNLLGGTFLRHFVYKMDLNAGVLRISEITGGPDKATPGAATQTPAGRSPGGDAPPPPDAPAPATPKPSGPQVQIVSARWGGGKHWADVTAAVATLLQRGEPFAINPKTLGADPTPGWRKRLEITYTVNGERKTLQINEDKNLAAADLLSGS